MQMLLMQKKMITQDSLKNSQVGLYYTDKSDPHVLNNMLNISILASSGSSEIFTNRMPSAHNSVIIKQ